MGGRGGPAHPSSSKGKGLQEVVTFPPCCRSRLLVSGLYPGSPYERRFFALELLSAVLEAWGPDGTGTSAAAATGGGGGGGCENGGGKVARGGGGGGKGLQDRPQGGRMAESTSLSLLPRGYNLSAAAGGGGGGRSGRVAAVVGPPFRPYCAELLTPNTVALLLAGAVDSWDKLRQAASSCLMRLPTPLPGLATREQLTPLLGWAGGLLWSPRARESDAGSRLIKILYGKYVAGCGWRLALHPAPRAIPPQPPPPPPAAPYPSPPAASADRPPHDSDPPTAAAGQGAAPYCAVLDFLDGVLDLIDAQVAAAREDLAAACRGSLAHGPLLLLRYVIEDVPWGEVAAAREGWAAAAAGWAARALAAAEAIVDIALPVLSRPQERNVGAEEVDTAMMEDEEEEGGGGGEDEAGADGDDDDALGPEAQVIITACWTTVKEVSLVLATMVRHMPLPTTAAPASSVPAATAASSPGSTSGAGADGATATPVAAAMLSFEQLRRVGDLLVRLLFEMKHNGAVDKTALALTAVTERLLRASGLELNGLPRPWLEACIRRVLAPCQSRDDIVRRSAGLPFAFGALFLAEPSNAPKALLARGMTTLLAVAAAATSPHLTSTEAETEAEAEAEAEAVVVVDHFEVRQVWPVVHAFNCLRHAFNDGHLAVDTSGFFAPAIQACLRALRSPAWEIRNSAMLCFTALTTRVLGFKNDSHGESCRKAVSGAEFFQRYPALHGFLLEQLREAAAELEAAAAATAAGGRSTAAPANPHPGLYPVLIILSRLKASHIRDEAAATAVASQASSVTQLPGQGDGGGEAAAPAAAATATAVATYMGGLTPVAFTPLVRRCAMAAPYAVRRLAARALGPLVAAQDAPTLLQQLLAGVPAEVRGGGGGGGGGLVRPVGSSNALQGALLQAAALLDNAVLDDRAADAVGGGGGGSSAAACGQDICKAALPHLARGAWLADPRVGCSALGCALLQAAAAALRLLPPGRCLEFRSEVGALAAVCRQAVCFEPPAVWRRRQMGGGGGGDGGERGGGGGVNLFASDFPDPMRSQLMKLVTQLWLGPVLLCQSLRSSSPAAYFLEGLLHQLRCCLASYLYDARAAALKSLVRFLAAVNGGAAALAASASSPSGVGLAAPTAGGSGMADAGGRTAAPTAAAEAAMATAIAAASGGAADPGGKLSRLVVDLLSRPVLVRRLVSEGMALLWEAVAVEPVHKVVRRALKALGLLHTLSTTLSPADTALVNADAAVAAGVSSASGPSPVGLDPITAEPLAAAAGTTASLQHPLGCLCCTDDPRIGRVTDAAGGDLRNALSHVVLLQRLLSEGCKELEARCEALRCLGRALGSAVRAAADESRPLAAATEASQAAALVAALKFLMNQVLTATQPWQPEDWRLAGAEALAASRLLQSSARVRGQQPPEAEAEVEAEAGGASPSGPLGRGAEAVQLLAVRGWRFVITFLEDEDHGVRYTATRLAQEVMELADSAGAASTEIEPGVYGKQPLYVEAVIRRLYNWLAMQYGACGGGGEATRAALVGMLCELVTGGGGGGGEDSASAAAVPEVVTAAAASASAGSAAHVGWAPQARRLFDKEADNPHEEPLLTAQLAARTLRTLLAAPPAVFEAHGDFAGSGGESPAAIAEASQLAAAAVLTEVGAERLKRWGAVAAEQLRAVSAAVTAAASGAAATAAGGDDGTVGAPSAVADGWLGGFVNHPEIFTCAYKALLALWALGPVRQHMVPPDSGDAAADGDLAAALRSLCSRGDVRGSQLAPLLVEVKREWAGEPGLRSSSVDAAEERKEVADGGSKGEEAREASEAEPANMLFLL